MSRQNKAHLQRPLWTAQLLLCTWISVELRFWLSTGRNGAGKPGPDLEVDPADGQGDHRGRRAGKLPANILTVSLKVFFEEPSL